MTESISVGILWQIRMWTCWACIFCLCDL